MPPSLIILASTLGAAALPLAVRWYDESLAPTLRRQLAVAALAALVQGLGFWLIAPLAPWPYWSAVAALVVVTAAVMGYGLGWDLLDGLLLLIAVWILGAAAAAVCGVALGSLAGGGGRLG